MLKDSTESINKRGNMLGVVPCDDNVIYLEKKINNGVVRLKNEQLSAIVNLRCNK